LLDLSDPERNSADQTMLIIDSDIVFYRPIMPLIENALQDHDILFQRNTYLNLHDVANIGVIAFKPSGKVHAFWKAVYEQVLQTKGWDQGAVNQLMNDTSLTDKLGIKFHLLPPSVWCWSLHLDRAPLGSIILHHANCMKTPVEKWLQYNMFFDLFSSKTKFPDTNRDLIVQNLTLSRWRFGQLGNPQDYGLMTFESDGRIMTYNHPNEKTYYLSEKSIVFLNEGNYPTACFDEFYFDQINGRYMAIGKNASYFIDREQKPKAIFYLTTQLF
jgi:hypothetical protein